MSEIAPAMRPVRRFLNARRRSTVRSSSRSGARLACVLAGLLAVAAPESAPAADGDEALLRRHAPLLVLDSGERWPPAAVEAAFRPGTRLLEEDGRLIAASDAREVGRTLTADYLGGRYPPPRGSRLGPEAFAGDRLDIAAGDPRPNSRPGPVYGRVVRGRDEVWLQYWVFYLYNAQDRGVVATGRHEGDWELVQVGLDRRLRPRSAVYLQHDDAERCPWGDVERRGPAPVVYVANASHSAHFRAGVHRRRIFPDPNDEADGDGPGLRPRVVPIGAGSPGWAGWPGRWGASRGGWVPGEQESPRGPAFQPDDRWTDPGRFAEGAGRCTADCGRRLGCRPLLTALARYWPGGVLTLAAYVALLAVRQRRRGTGD